MDAWLILVGLELAMVPDKHGLRVVLFLLIDCCNHALMMTRKSPPLVFS